MKYIALDTETTGLDSFKGDKPFAITTCDEEENTGYASIGEDDLVPIDLICNSKHYGKVFHNLKFDALMLKVYGIKVVPEMHDTMIMAHVYNFDEPSKGLKRLAEKYLQEEPADEKKLKQYIRKHKLKNYSQIPRDILEPYARTDARITMGLFQFYKERGILEDPTYILEMKLLPVLIRMQVRGVPLDVAYCVTQSNKCAACLRAIEETIQAEYGNININSNKQLSEFLFKKEGLDCHKYSEKGNAVLDEYNLKQYNHPIVPQIIKHRELAKIKKTYLDGLQDKADKDGVIHCSLNQIGAKTGRFSSSAPSLQVIPVRGAVSIRKAFIVRPEYTNYYLDYSQIELRIFAHYAKEHVMIEELLKPDGDLHSATAKRIFGPDFTKEHRDIAKRLNFGIIYGIGAFGFAEILNKEYPNKKFTPAQAKVFIGKYYIAYPAVRQFTWNVSRTILSRGHIHDVFKRKYKCPANQTYKAVNYLIQGCAAGVLKNAMVEVDELLLNKKSNLLLCIHDELVTEIHDSETELVPKIKAIMEDHETFRVPLLVNVEKSDISWAEKC